MKKNLLYVALLAPGLLLSAACGADRTANGAMAETSVLSDENHAGHDEEDNEEHRGESEHVELSADEVVASGIVIAEAERGDVSVPLELPAEIRFDADRVARVSSKVEGIVSRLYVGEGDSVGAGSALALLTSRELAGLKADYLNALSAERLSRAELDREEQLWEQKITSDADVQSARAEYTAAKATRQATENRLHAVGVSHRLLDALDEAEDGSFSQAVVTSPISGKVIQRNISLGETVSMDADPLFVIVDDSVVWADIAVYKEDLSKVDSGMDVELMRDDGGVLATGEIWTVLPVINETSRTATARVIVENAEHRMKPGQFVTARLATGATRSVVRVPSDAIVIVEGNPSVFVPTDDGFEPRQVEAGASARGFSEIRSGLAEGERFVSNGAFTLKAQLEKDAFGDGHAH
ncbi:efflux RND transporter periplasmic adaptor subunit [Hyphomonas jannaschiana]|jgi:cobalt-zinc-cadmium efflux system membrane fusion protein|uniref:Secretion protein HlyD n=1 Tax=Hyphomonas jannaschiana VP2 TaxID=1280952 RepID=A0A059FI22_9PROT|nr:efflux RND transporter periplasmic adaptor subunit [Hyphomonas jannaschiana]KCZ90262.1 Secretion protein HlyD [Hyphomonas jannaschiana VP2]